MSQQSEMKLATRNVHFQSPTKILSLRVSMPSAIVSDCHLVFN